MRINIPYLELKSEKGGVTKKGKVFANGQMLLALIFTQWRQVDILIEILLGKQQKWDWILVWHYDWDIHIDEEGVIFISISSVSIVSPADELFEVGPSKKQPTWPKGNKITNKRIHLG